MLNIVQSYKLFWIVLFERCALYFSLTIYFMNELRKNHQSKLSTVQISNDVDDIFWDRLLGAIFQILHNENLLTIIPP